MATCIDNSRNHAINCLTADTRTSQINTSRCRAIGLCRPSSSGSGMCHSAHKYGNNSQKGENILRVIPQVEVDEIWDQIRQEAAFDMKQEPVLSKYYWSLVLSHKSLESALANHLASKLCDENVSREKLYDVFLKVLVEEGEIRAAIRDDLKAVQARDPACENYVHCLLNFKGFLACQAHRLAHKLWSQSRTLLAFYIQSQVSHVFGVDIHPGAKIGRGIVFDHATGIVIGETAIIGDNVTILHNVTLGGTGKVRGDRHPKIGNGVFIGAGTKVLGNVKIGGNAKIGAGSVVLKEIPAGATAVGNPARLIGMAQS